VLAGERCEQLMARKIQSIAVRDVECDELWSFIGKKEKRVRPEDDQNLGDCYTFVAIERHSKLVLNIAMGKRDQATTDIFIEGLRHATRGEFQITLLPRFPMWRWSQLWVAPTLNEFAPRLWNGRI
jgi:hypothetical protein